MTPSATRSRTISHIVRRLRGSRPVVGSSRKMIRGSPTRRHGEVEPAPHAAGVGGGGLVGRLDEVEPLEQFARRAAGLRARPRWCRSAIRVRFSSPVSRSSTAENWPVTPIAARTASGSRARSWPATRSVAGVGADEGGQDLDDRGLAGAVGAEQREDRSLGDVEVDAVEHEVVAEGLAQAGRGDRRSRACHEFWFSGDVVADVRQGRLIRRRRAVVRARTSTVSVGRLGSVGGGERVVDLPGRRRGRRARRRCPRGCRPRGRRAGSRARPSRARPRQPDVAVGGLGDDAGMRHGRRRCRRWPR